MQDVEYLTIEQAADLLQVHYNTIHRWLNSGVLVGAKFGDSWRIKKSDIDALFEKQRSTNDSSTT